MCIRDSSKIKPKLVHVLLTATNIENDITIRRIAIKCLGKLEDRSKNTAGHTFRFVEWVLTQNKSQARHAILSLSLIHI